MVVTEHIVNNVEELLNAWDSAQSGDTIYLKAGEYGDVSLRRAEFEDTVTITSLDPENPAMLNTLALVEVDNVQVKSLVIDLTANETTSQEVRGILVSGSKNVQVHDNVINGDDSVVGVLIISDPDTKLNNVPYIGEPIGNAVYVVRSEGIIISENEIIGFRRGINLFEFEGVIVRDNEVYDLRQTVLRGVNLDDVFIEGNEFYSIYLVNYGGRGDHANFIQFRQAMGSEEFSENIIIKDNFFHQGSGIPV